jgi:hypothetical protein
MMDDGRVTQPREDPRPDPKRLDPKRLEKVFGDVLPETTADERDPDRRRDTSDSWYEENRPPHHEDR